MHECTPSSPSVQTRARGLALALRRQGDKGRAAEECDSGHQKIQVHGQAFLAGGHFGSGSTASSSLKVAICEGLGQKCCRALPVLGPGGPALRVGLPPDDLGFCVHGLGLAAGAVPGLACLQRFPPSLRVVKGLVSAYLEFLVTANIQQGLRLSSAGVQVAGP